MAKETMIVFVYDTECLKDEADDPVNAVLYFHPSWVSDQQKVALCGQLMGASYFLNDCFFKPRIMSLQNGKFVLKEFGRFILAVGTDRNISDYLLEHRANLLVALLRFFHRDIQNIHDQFALQSQYKNLSEKLYHIFETYLPILQCNGNIFQNVPKLRMPKTASNIFLDAMQTLQCCQQTKGILGGAILYHNKVVATQLGDVITKHLVLTDPLHIRTTAEQITNHGIDLHIPNGVQMLIVYVEISQYHNLKADAQRAQNLQTTQLSQAALTFHNNKRKMKRDKSLIFTNIPEEGSTVGANTIGGEESASQPQPMRPKSLMIRPTHLPLRFKNTMSSKELPESGIASINFDETDSYPEFIGRTSVCSTPMTENKVLQVGNIMSICANPEEEQNSNKQKSSSSTVAHRLSSNNRKNSLKKDFDKFFQNFIASNPNKQMERRNSFTDLQDSLKKISKKLSLKQFSTTQNNSKKTDVNSNGGNNKQEISPDCIDNGDDVVEESCDTNSSSSEEQAKPTLLSITDPTEPMFNANGQPISRSLFQEFLERYYKLWDDESDEQKKNEEIAELIEQFKEFDAELQQLAASSFKADANLNIHKLELESPLMPKALTDALKAKTPMDKRASLSLPIKALGEITPAASEGFISGVRKQSIGGVPLTPLMAKLSVLALNEDQRWEAGSSANIEIQTPLTTSKLLPRRSSVVKCEDAVDALSVLNSNQGKDGLKRLELYMCGQQNMTMLLLMDEGSAHQQSIVQKMFDICVSRFPHMESQLSQTLNVNVEGDKREGYSFISLDSKWNALQRSGPWNPMELNTLEFMHRDLMADNKITDLLLRSHDSVYYGYKSGRTEIFYKEPAHHISGIPPPSDPLGNVSMKAKTQLERDHSYILF